MRRAATLLKGRRHRFYLRQKLEGPLACVLHHAKPDDYSAPCRTAPSPRRGHSQASTGLFVLDGDGAHGTMQRLARPATRYGASSGPNHQAQYADHHHHRQPPRHDPPIRHPAGLESGPVFACRPRQRRRHTSQTQQGKHRRIRTLQRLTVWSAVVGFWVVVIRAFL